MQDIAYLKIGDEIHLVLRRARKYGVALKLRKSGNLGSYLQAESEFFAENPRLLSDLLSGKVVCL